MLLEHLWPKLETIVSVDWRINTTGCSDYILPAAQHYEKANQPYSSPMHLHHAADREGGGAAGEARSEWQIILGLLPKGLERAGQGAGIKPWQAAQRRARGSGWNCGSQLTKDGGVLVDEERLVSRGHPGQRDPGHAPRRHQLRDPAREGSGARRGLGQLGHDALPAVARSSPTRPTPPGATTSSS